MKYNSTPARLAIVSAASIAGTTAMTAFSYGRSRLGNEQFKEPQLLGYLMYKDSPHKLLKERQQQHPRATLLHYLAGQGFGLGYEYLWKPAVKLPTLARGAAYGVLAGLIGVTVWEATIRLRDKPPALDKKLFYPHLIMAHIIYGATSAMVSRALWRK